MKIPVNIGSGSWSFLFFLLMTKYEQNGIDHKVGFIILKIWGDTESVSTGVSASL